MAGEAIISLRAEICQEPEVLQIAAALDLSEFDAVGRLACIWGWAVKHAVDGLAAGLSGCAVDALVRLPGFAAAMQDAGWLQITAEGLQFPAWDRWLSRTARKRAEAAARKARSRAPAGPSSVRTSPQSQTATPSPAVTSRDTPQQVQPADAPPVQTPAEPPPVTSRDTPPPAENPPTRKQTTPADSTSVFARVTDAVLTDVGKLREWFDWQASQPAPVLQHSEQNWHTCTAAAYRASKQGKYPARLFASLVGKRMWKNITAADEDGARNWLREHNRRTRAAEEAATNDRASPQQSDSRSRGTGPQQLSRDDLIHQLSAVQQNCRRA